MYDEALMKELSEIMKGYNIFNGYSNIGQAEEDFDDEEHRTVFFSYNEQEVGEK